MKKKILTLTIMIACSAMVALFCGPAMAAVSGACVECHTMHNSQGGSVVATDGPYGALIRNTCLGCHTTTGSDGLVGIYPYVKTSGSFGVNYLAGGYFATTAGGDNHNDNSHTLGSTTTPAGDPASFYTGGTGGLTCAGSSGCHGTESVTDESASISGGHHGNNISLGYRMLGVDTVKVSGTGASDYEEALNLAEGVSFSGAHNLYSANPTSEASISELCGKCHGDFHGTSVGETKNADGAWIRHPTDNLISTDWEIQSTGYTYDSKDWYYNPVGTIDAVAPAAGNMYATCISCHRAHGSPYADILRFVYSDQEANSSVDYGCLGCHNKQRS